MCERALWGIHPACVNVAAQDGGSVTACRTRGGDTADLAVRRSGVFDMQLRRLLRGRLYDSQIMTHSSLWLQLSGFQQTRELLNQTSRQRARSSAKPWRKQASQRCSGSSSVGHESSQVLCLHGLIKISSKFCFGIFVENSVLILVYLQPRKSNSWPERVLLLNTRWQRASPLPCDLLCLLWLPPSSANGFLGCCCSRVMRLRRGSEAFTHASSSLAPTHESISYCMMWVLVWENCSISQTNITFTCTSVVHLQLD